MTSRVAAYRRSHPKSRVLSAVKYLRNGGIVRQQVCVLCGEQGPTWDGRWPKTQRAEAFSTRHTLELCCDR